MAFIHQTTVTPSKTDVVATWLPSRQWYRGTTPRIRKAGGFRLDDPAGEVGIEFLLFVDDSGADEVLYQVPLTYRGAPLPGGDSALVGTAEHGVLGSRWIYDGTRDPVAIGAVVDLLTGRTTAQAQSLSDTPDLTVVVTQPEHRSIEGEVGVGVDGIAYTDVPIGSAVVRFHRSPTAVRLGAACSVAAPSALGPVVELITVLTD
ncbi:1,4-alpha-glucan branching protein [Nocardia sp. XZ_19_231]|uniref:maltokinase N-terminal cap-like domain-containing protein n=1 Tax=Nocardia sp. XZ_19_231 TaxID=2769252 RepID=UPI00188EF7AD|nr:1,4-alpha-glucan branching protein [Nocardia sp. XZ_19_231]